MDKQADKNDARLSRLDRMIRSVAAPPDCMNLSEMDGFLTAIAAGPQTIPESEWLPLVLGGSLRALPRIGQELLANIRLHHDVLVATLRDTSDSIRPVFWNGSGGVILASDWCEGFMQAVQLRFDAWDPLIEDEAYSYLMMPILSGCRDGKGQPMSGLDLRKEKGPLNQLARMIPAAIAGIYRYWRGQQVRVHTLTPVAPVRKSQAPGRNDPCPCGSGKKYKRCCDGKSAIPANVQKAEMELTRHRVASSSQQSLRANDHEIPPAKSARPPAAGMQWLDAGQSLEIAGIKIQRGLVYTGYAPRAAVSSLLRSLGIAGLTTAGQLAEQTVEPSMIDPSLAVRPWQTGKPDSLPHYNYPPSYREFSPEYRGRYLRWLADGAKDPIDTGYVQLYLFGLERRLLVDTVGRPEDAAVALAELDRIAACYGKGFSLGQRCGDLKEFVRLRDLKPEEMTSSPDRTSEAEQQGYVSLAFRYKLGVHARDRLPLPAALALQLVHGDASIPKRTAVHRCPQAFSTAFADAYRKLYGAGLLLARNKARLQGIYYAQSPALRRQRFHLAWDDLPDVLKTAGPRKKLTAAVDLATDRIDAYSRFVSRYPERADSLVATLMLPVSCWPEPLRQRLQRLRQALSAGLESFSFEQLLQRIDPKFKDAASMTAGTVTAFAKALAGASIGLEPDVLNAPRKLTPAEAVVPFPLSTAGATEQPERSSQDYRIASTWTALLGCVVHSRSDSTPSNSEVEPWLSKVPGWSTLHPDLQQRLRAQCCLHRRQPLRLSSLKAHAAAIPAQHRSQLANLLSAVANAAGAPSLSQVRMLEQIYAMLQFDERLVYTHLHSPAELPAGSTGDTTSKKHSTEVLDAARIARLQHETAAVSALLADVFAADDTAHTSPSVPPPSVTVDSPLPGLDAAHAAFVARSLERPRWLRAELEALAVELRLMLDGAFERINDASLDLTGEILLEGDDPIDVHLELLEGTAP